MAEANPSLPLAYATDPALAEPERVYWGLTLSAWLKIGIVTLLMVLTFRFSLVRLWLKTNPISGEANWGHSICVPLIGLYYLYIHRDELLRTPVKTAWTGLGILLMGLLVFMYGIWPGQNDFIKDFGMVVTLFGVVLLLCGWAVMRIAWFPIAFLVCAIPWPGLVYSWVAGPLQELAARGAVVTLRATGVQAGRAGTKIMMEGYNGVVRTLNVAEACAGLRSLMTFISVAAAVAFLSARPLWQKIVITASAVPIAIFCNVVRVSGQGLLDHYVSEEWSQNFAHQFAGLVMLIPAFFLILLVGWVLDNLFVEEVDEEDKRQIMRPATAAVPAPAPSMKAATVGAAIAGIGSTGGNGSNAAGTTTTTTTPRTPVMATPPRRNLTPRSVPSSPSVPPKPQANAPASASRNPGQHKKSPNIFGAQRPDDSKKGGAQ